MKSPAEPPAANDGQDGASPSAGSDGIPVKSLRDRMVRGVAWSTGGKMAGEALRLANNVVLTRLLDPATFGLMLLVNAALRGMAMFSDFGVSANVVQSPRGDEPRFLDTAWSVQVVRGVVLFILCLALATTFASFYPDKPELAVLLPVAGLSFLISGVQSMSLATWKRHLRVGQLTAIDLGTQLCSIAFMITWAWFAPSVWALVAGTLFGAVLKSVLSYVVSGARRPHFVFYRDCLSSMLGFSAWVFVLSTMFFLGNELDRFALGSILTATELGVYSIAIAVAAIPYGLLSKITGSILFPALGRAREAGHDLKRTYRRAKMVILTVAGALVSTLIVTGPILVDILYSDAYLDAGWMIMPVALGQWFRINSLSPTTVLLSLGLPRLSVVPEFLRIVGYACFVPLGFYLEGLLGGLFGFVAGEWLGALAYGVVVSRRKLGGQGLEMLSTVVLAASVVVGITVRSALLEAGTGRIAILFCSAIVVCVFWLPHLRRAWTIYRSEKD